jgi:hypothetical protein
VYQVVAGLSRMPVYRLEAGQDISLGSYLAMLQALGYSIQLQERSTKPLHINDLARAFAHLHEEADE